MLKGVISVLHWRQYSRFSRFNN